MTEILISADSHVVEPIHLWKDRLPVRLRERAPQRRMLDDGRVAFCIPMEDTFVQMLAADMNMYDDATENPDGGYDAQARLYEVEADGVYAEVLYPTVGLFAWSMTDDELAIECAKVYNSWLAESFNGHFDRFACPAMIPTCDLKAAEKEIERAAKLGLQAAMFPIMPPVHRPYYSKEYERLWAAAAAHGMPVTFHAASGFPAAQMAQFDTATMDPVAILNAVMVQSYPAHSTISHIVGCGALERHPTLNLVLVEVQAGWLAWLMNELDLAFQGRQWGSHVKLDMLPSEYIRRQVCATFMDDRIGIANRHLTGIDSLMWGSDYPHPEGTWPHTRKVLDEIMDGIEPESRAAIVGGNAARVFGFKPPA